VHLFKTRALNALARPCIKADFTSNLVLYRRAFTQQPLTYRRNSSTKLCQIIAPNTTHNYPLSMTRIKRQTPLPTAPPFYPSLMTKPRTAQPTQSAAERSLQYTHYCTLYSTPYDGQRTSEICSLGGSHLPPNKPMSSIIDQTPPPPCTSEVICHWSRGWLCTLFSLQLTSCWIAPKRKKEKKSYLPLAVSACRKVSPFAH
jgi:hypothetical protein